MASIYLLPFAIRFFLFLLQPCVIASKKTLSSLFNTANHRFAAAVIGIYDDHTLHSTTTPYKDDVIVAGDDMEIRRRMMATFPHVSPTSPRNLRRKLLYTSSEHEEDRPSPAATTKSNSLAGISSSEDVTIKKEGIQYSIVVAGNHKDGVVFTASRRCRRLIAASGSDSPPAPGYRRR